MTDTTDPDRGVAGFVYLASQSPRRQELLRQVGIRFELLAPDPNEDVESLEAHIAGESPSQYVRRVVIAKAAAARLRLERRSLSPAPILVADTTVAIGATLLGKPIDDDDARRMLQALSGRNHRVLTAVAVVSARRTDHATSTSRVRFARLRAAQIDAYVASGEPRGKAGAYAVQGLAAAFIRRIEGSYSGIMGLPLFETTTLLRRAGIGRFESLNRIAHDRRHPG
jgi:septum formation protein